MADQLDEEIARLERELEAKRAERARGGYAAEIREHAAFFLAMADAGVTVKMAAAVDALRVARRRYERVPEHEASPARAKGTGSVGRNGNGWRWKIQRAGEWLTSRTWPTREEAEGELARVLTDPAFVPAEKQRSSVLEGVRVQHCSRCGASDHRGHRCPEIAARALPTPTPLAPPQISHAPAREPPRPAVAKAEAGAYIHPGSGWGPIEEGGLVRHLLCDGKGMVSHDNGNGKVTRKHCQPCRGEGLKRCLKKHAA